MRAVLVGPGDRSRCEIHQLIKHPIRVIIVLGDNGPCDGRYISSVASGVRSVGPANCSFRFRDGNEHQWHARAPRPPLGLGDCVTRSWTSQELAATCQICMSVKFLVFEYYKLCCVNIRWRTTYGLIKKVFFDVWRLSLRPMTWHVLWGPGRPRPRSPENRSSHDMGRSDKCHTSKSFLEIDHKQA